MSKDAAATIAQLQGHRYINLITFRKTGVAVPTAVWFAEKDGKIYVMTRSDSGKFKRIRNNPRVQIAPCTARGRSTGPAFGAVARVLSRDEEAVARQALAQKYWLMRFPWLWSRKNIFLELEVDKSRNAEDAETERS